MTIKPFRLEFFSWLLIVYDMIQNGTNQVGILAIDSIEIEHHEKGTWADKRLRFHGLQLALPLIIYIYLFYFILSYYLMGDLILALGHRRQHIYNVMNISWFLICICKTRGSTQCIQRNFNSAVVCNAIQKC